MIKSLILELRLFQKLSFKFFYLLRLPFFRILNDHQDKIAIPDSMSDSINLISSLISKSRDIRCIQFLKVLLAAKLRYDNSSYDLTKKALNLSYLCKKYKKAFYFSNFEPVIHLESDPLESIEISPDGNIHNDFDERGGLYGTDVIWIPATDYLYPGIVMMPKFIQVIAHIFSILPNIFKLIIISQKSKSLPIRHYHKKGDLIEWNDSFLHGGIPNDSSKNSIALVLRVSNNKSNLTPYKIYKENDTKNSYKISHFPSKEFDEVSLNIDKVLNTLISSHSLLEKKSVDEWLLSSKKKFSSLALEKNSKAYKYILSFWETRENLIYKYGLLK